MSEMKTLEVNGSRLILHCGGNVASWDEVENVETPEATDTFCPVPHTFVVEQVKEGLTNLGFRVTSEAHALWGKGMRYFGLLGIQGYTPQDAMHDDLGIGDGQWVFGIRNAHDRSAPSSGVLGKQMAVCDNLLFHSREAMFRFQRRHTRYVMRDLPGLIATRLADLREAMAFATNREKHYTQFRFDRAEAAAGLRPGTLLNDALMRCLRVGAITATALPHIIKEYTRDDGPGGCAYAGEAWQQPTLWRLQQAVTEVEKARPSLMNLNTRHSRLNGIFDAIACGHDPVDVDAEVEV